MDEVYLQKSKQKVEEAAFFKACLAGCGKCQIWTVYACCGVPVACGCSPTKEIAQGQVGLLMTFGKYEARLDPGFHTYNPCTDRIQVVDMRSQIIDVPNQILLTKDNVSLTVDAFVNFRIANPELASFKVVDYKQMIFYLTQGAMKSVVGENTLAELLSKRKSIEKGITDIIEKQTDPYGIHVDLIETQRIMLPKSMERAMAIVAETQKQSEARVIDAKGNLESAKIFKEAADELSKNDISLQLQYFETLKYIAAEKNSTIIVPDSVLSFARNR